jgi:hypothetical protein
VVGHQLNIVYLTEDHATVAQHAKADILGPVFMTAEGLSSKIPPMASIKSSMSPVVGIDLAKSLGRGMGSPSSRYLNEA